MVIDRTTNIPFIRLENVAETRGHEHQREPMNGRNVLKGDFGFYFGIEKPMHYFASCLQNDGNTE